MGSLRSEMTAENEEELAFFNEMRRQEQEENDDLLLLEKSDEFDALIGSKDGRSSILNGGACTPAQTTVAHEFLYAENDKNDYEWLLTPPGTPLFPSLEMETPKTVMGQLRTLKPSPTALKSRLPNLPESTVRSNSRQPSSSSPELTTSIPSIRRPSSSGSPRPKPTTRSTLNNPTKPESNTTLPKASPSPRPTRPSSSAKTTITPRSSTPILGSKPTSRAATPTRRPSSSSISMNKPSTTSIKNPVADASSATRGRPRMPSSIEPVGTGKVRRQSCSPARGRLPNRTTLHGSGSSVPILAMSRLHAKANDNVSPVMVGAKMVERVVNSRKLAPPRQDNKTSSNTNLPSPESSGFGRNLSKKSLDMAIRHMDIRRTIPSNPRPSAHSVRTKPTG